MAIANTSRRQAGRRPAAPIRKAGTWKLAYADFLTALAAFFLLMWLVSGVAVEDRAVIAAEFSGKPAASDAASLPASGAGATLKAALGNSPALAGAGDSVQLTAHAGSVRLELVDTASRPLFQTGSGMLTPNGLALVRAAATSLNTTPYPLSIEGHTDAFQIAGDAYSNWDLSSARANEARRVLSEAGIAPERLRAVTGYADTRPLIAGQPHLPANRRISVQIHLPD